MDFMYCTSSRTNRSRFLGFIKRNGYGYTVEDTPTISRFIVQCEDFDEYVECRDEVELMPTDYLIY